MSTQDYYNQIINYPGDHINMNSVLNQALRDDRIISKDYCYLISVARSLGFTFADHWKLLND